MKLLLLTLLAMVLCVCAATALSEAASSFKSSVTDYENNAAVNTFRDYIRINTSQPSEGNANYDEAVVFWKIQAASLGLNATVFEYYPGKPIVVITWEGTNTSLPSIMLNSHMDVVAVDESVWSHPPFAAEMDSDGNIYGRGTQDMKSVGIQYLEAIRRLMADNVTLARTIHMSMVPDEEIGGAQGMQAFLKSDDFAALNVGFVMDEGIPYTNSSYKVFYADRTPWQIVITCTGPAGHGSLMLEDTAADKFRNIINLFLDFRTKQMAYIKANPDKDPGLVTSINLTKVSGGLAMNIIPGTMSASFDIRIAPGTNETQFNETVSSWIRDAGGDDCSHHYVRYESIAPATILDNNVYWTAFKQAADEMVLVIEPIICSGTTDMIFVRRLGIPALGFAPMHNTQMRSHANNEYLNVEIFLHGINIYQKLISKIANV